MSINESKLSPGCKPISTHRLHVWLAHLRVSGTYLARPWSWTIWERDGWPFFLCKLITVSFDSALFDDTKHKVVKAQSFHAQRFLDTLPIKIVNLINMACCEGFALLACINSVRVYHTSKCLLMQAVGSCLSCDWAMSFVRTLMRFTWCTLIRTGEDFVVSTPNHLHGSCFSSEAFQSSTGHNSNLILHALLQRDSAQPFRGGPLTGRRLPIQVSTQIRWYGM